MKILLLGDYSAVHQNLKKGLVALGHECLCVNLGDNFKKLGTDFGLDSRIKNKLFNQIDRGLKLRKLYKLARKFDAVQFVNPNCLYNHKVCHHYITKLLKRIPIKVVLAAGCDPRYRDVCKDHEVCKSCEKFDKSGNRCDFDPKSDYYSKKYFDNFFDSVNAIVPILWDYYSVYQGSEYESKLTGVIPLPLDIQNIPFIQAGANEQIVVYHPLNRYGFKGTELVEKAFAILGEKYKDRAVFVIKGKMPLNEFLDFNKTVDIVVDQMYSQSYGMSAAYSLAQGKVVISGNKEATKELEYLTDCPVIDSTGTVDGLVDVISNLLDDREKIIELGQAGRTYAEKHHDCVKIAQEYVALYEKIKGQV